MSLEKNGNKEVTERLSGLPRFSPFSMRKALLLGTDCRSSRAVGGAFTSHASIFCTTGGATSKTLTPAAANSYYLVVPRNATHEGSYGKTSAGVERFAGANACLQRQIGTCP